MRILRPENDLGTHGVTEPAIFLAGPTPRSDDVATWRPRAVELFAAATFAGDLLLPEPFVGDFDSQVAWERAGLEQATLIIFWVPRNLDDLPGFTTNVEFGRYVTSGKILYGRPHQAPKTRYLDWLYELETGQPPLQTLEDLVVQAVNKVSK
jgi:hypothetical protein